MLGVLGGLGGAIGLAAFYKALSLGTMSVVSPIAACSALVPFVLSLATGERPATIAVDRRGPGARRRGARLGGGAAVGVAGARAGGRAGGRLGVALGLFVYFLGLGSREGDVLSTLVGARIGSLGAARRWSSAAQRATLRLPRRRSARSRPSASPTSSANALFAFASGHGLLALVSVLGSLYPVMTLLLAHVFLHERLTRAQQAGVAIALAGVIAIAAA